MTGDPRKAQEAVDAPIPRQRDAASVMGYVAELQQFDDSMTGTPDGEAPGDEATPDAPPAQSRRPAPNRARALDRPSAVGRAAVAVDRGGPGEAARAAVAADRGGPRDAAEPPAASGGGRRPGGPGAPRTGGAARVPETEGRPPWTRTEVGLAVAFVLVAALAIIGGAYAVIVASRPPTGDVRLPMPSAEAAQDQGGAVAGEPTPGEPSGSVEPTPAPGGGADPSGGGGPAPSGSVTPTPEATVAPPAAADLAATYSREANTGLLGLTGYRGKVTISNLGKGAADGWTVTLSLPSGQRVDSVEGAEARQEGELVTFTPQAGREAVAAGASVAFTFEVPGLLAGEPTGCAINGRPCQ